MNGYLIDTHAWLWVIHNAKHEVSSHFFSDLEDWQRQGLAYLSPFSCWELGLLVACNHVQIDQPIIDIWQRDTDTQSFRIAELSVPVLVQSTRLPGDIHRDPADRILVATAREYDLTLITRDKEILRYGKQGHVRARKP